MSEQRPVIPGFHPDPSICRVGEDYYLATSSFEYAPGVPIFRSTDLRSWTLIGHALSRPGQLDVSTAGPSGGIFAPTLRHHGGRFWMITTNWADKGGQVLSWAEDPAGEWSDPVRIPTAVGIDPDLSWDDDGTCYLTYAGFGPDGGEGIVQSVIDPATGAVLGDRRWLWSGTGGKFPEGPHLYRVGEWWYLLVAEGGTERGHAVTIARGPTPQGPFEACPDNPLLTRRGSDHPVQSTGHADLVQRPDETWAIVYHGVRARGSSPEWHVLGRETYADDVEWHDGWPRITTHIDPSPDGGEWALAGEQLPHDWVGQECFPEQVMSRADGTWTLRAPPGGPVFVGRRQEHLVMTTRARLGVDGVGGLSLRIDPRHALELESDGEVVRAVWAIGDVRHPLGERALGEGDLLELATRPSDGHEFSTRRGPDTVVAAVVSGGVVHELGAVDGRYLSTEVAGGMTGRMVGVTCTSGQVTIDSFVYAGEPDGAERVAGWAE
ncbi:family 43 glycosylhydrolase [Nocardioides sp. NPDC126508]